MTTTAGPLDDTGPSTILDLVDESIRRFPDKPAVLGSRGAVLTYADLDEVSRAWAAQLRRAGADHGRVVAVRAARSAGLAGLLLGVLRAGAAYSVVDLHWPTDRQRDAVRRVFPSVLVEHDVEPLPGLDLACPTLASDDLLSPPQATDDDKTSARVVGPDDPACIFWTSGSSGRPKAVVSPHRATARLFRPGAEVSGDSSSRMISAAAPAWDGFTLELWAMLCTGGTVVVHEETHFLPSDLRAMIADHGIDVIFLTTSLFHLFVDEDVEGFAGLARVLVGGERLSPRHCARFLAAHPLIELVNGYGPVECCGVVTTHRVREADLTSPSGIPLGTEVHGARVTVNDPDGAVLDHGEGEIWVAGHAVGLGYVGAVASADSTPSLVAFDAPPGHYRTGDRGRFESDGTLTFLGRADRQVKISGHRIEPTVVEIAAMALGLRKAVAQPVLDADGICTSLELFAERGSFAGSEDDVRRRLALTLPAPAVPGSITLLSHMQLSSNGKVDLASLRRAESGPG